MNDLRWIDNHCHLGDDAVAALATAREAGVHKVIDVGCDQATSRACVDRAATHDGVYATVGLHPHEARHGLDGLEEMLGERHVVAVGECGLDFHYDHSPRDRQRAMFAAQIELAHRHELPLVIHTREAWSDTFAILEQEGVPERVIFHCFTGGPDEAEAAVGLGAWLSFSGIVSFTSATEVAAAAARCPIDRLLVETDSPFLAPVPHRGKRNQPAWVGVVGARLADLRDETVIDVASATWHNAHRAYPQLGTA